MTATFARPLLLGLLLGMAAPASAALTPAEDQTSYTCAVTETGEIFGLADAFSGAAGSGLGSVVPYAGALIQLAGQDEPPLRFPAGALTTAFE